MKSFLFFFVSFFFFYVNAQIEAPPDFEGELLYKFDTDSIPDSGIRLKEVVLFQPLRFKNMNQLRDYVILRNRTLRVYPYAKLASDRLDTLSVRLNSINGKKQKKKESLQYFKMSLVMMHLEKCGGSQMVQVMPEKDLTVSLYLIQKENTHTTLN